MRGIVGHHNKNKTAKRILFLPHIFPIMGGGDDRQDMWCRREANVKLADTVRIMPHSAAIPAHEVRERCFEPRRASMHWLRPSDKTHTHNPTVSRQRNPEPHACTTYPAVHPTTHPKEVKYE